MQTVVNSCCFRQTKLIFCKIFLPALIHGLGSTILECWHFLKSVKAGKVWTFAVWWKMERIFCLARGAFPASFMVIWLLQSCGPYDCLKGCYANIASTIYSIAATAYLHLTIVDILVPVNMEPEFQILAKPPGVVTTLPLPYTDENESLLLTYWRTYGPPYHVHYRLLPRFHVRAGYQLKGFKHPLFNALWEVPENN